MTATRFEVDRVVLATAEEVLGAAEISLDDNFFALGGTSMAAIDLILLLSERLSIDVALDIIFEHPTFGLMSREVACALPGPAGEADGGPRP